uniref:Uncharacterized protein n=1 Tax=Oryza punctata TaxID=4537 RepID=A0A0E0L7E0_ORYPU
MDKILAFSILSSSPAEIAAPGYYTRFSWRTTSAGKQQTAEKAPTKQQEGNKQAGQSSRPAAERKPEARPRFAPEFDGINCFESIVPF